MIKFSFITKSFSSHAHKPAIKFVGKRSLIQAPKHIAVHHESINLRASDESLSVSPTSTQNLRPKLTNEEIDFINNGGPLVFKDWSKVKIKAKKFI